MKPESEALLATKRALRDQYRRMRDVVARRMGARVEPEPNLAKPKPAMKTIRRDRPAYILPNIDGEHLKHLFTPVVTGNTQWIPDPSPHTYLSFASSTAAVSSSYGEQLLEMQRQERLRIEATYELWDRRAEMYIERAKMEFKEIGGKVQRFSFLSGLERRDGRFVRCTHMFCGDVEMRVIGYEIAPRMRTSRTLSIMWIMLPRRQYISDLSHYDYYGKVHLHDLGTNPELALPRFQQTWHYEIDEPF
jgi:hypothetical protein